VAKTLEDNSPRSAAAERYVRTRDSRHPAATDLVGAAHLAVEVAEDVGIGAREVEGEGAAAAATDNSTEPCTPSL
jgi:hypothetical protein